MPAKLKNKRITQAAGRRAKARGNAKKPGCQGIGGAKADTPRIIANSFFALTAKPKPAIAVALIQEGKSAISSCDDNYTKMYNDVLKCARRAISLVTGEESTFDPYKSGFDLSESFEFIFRMLKTNVIPKDWDYNIEQDHKGNYHIVIYKTCDFQTFWHVFDVGATLQHLYKSNRRLHNMFVLFLHNFCKKTAMDTWHKSGVGYADEDILLDRFQNYEYDTEDEKEERFLEMNQTIEEYKTGIVGTYLNLIRSQKTLTVDQLKKQLSKFSKRSHLVKWMYSACDVMELQPNLSDFIYPELEETSDGGIMFDQQLVVLWNIKDLYSLEQEEFLECEAQGIGIQEPIYTARLKPDMQTLDIEAMKQALTYPQQFTKLYYQYQAAIKKYE